MLIFLSLIGFVALISFGIYSVGVVAQNRILKTENTRLKIQVDELQNILVDSADTRRFDLPPIGKKILNG